MTTGSGAGTGVPTTTGPVLRLAGAGGIPNGLDTEDDAEAAAAASAWICSSRAKALAMASSLDVLAFMIMMATMASGCHCPHDWAPRGGGGRARVSASSACYSVNFADFKLQCKSNMLSVTVQELAPQG